MNCKQLLSELGVDKELVMEFFVVFSRFEFALKRAGCLKTDNGRAKPDWTKFTADYEKTFDPEKKPRLREAWNYLENEPPMIQVVVDGKLDFRVDERLRDMSPFRKATEAVRTVRNNLFHGGKFPNSGVVDDPARKTKLLKKCTILLNEMLVLAPDVKAHFDNIELSRLLCD